MSDTSKTVEHNKLILEYLVFGVGEETVICLHGHGRQANDFKFISDHGKKVIAIHLFFHGNSFFPIERIEKKPLTLDEFHELFRLILTNEKVSNFHLFAFSQGGRFSLCLIPFVSKNVLSFTLIAPDGMDNNSFYNWSSRQKWARRIFTRLEQNPGKIIKYSKIAKNLKIIRPKVKDFVDEFSKDKSTFIRASRSWRAFRMLQPDVKLISKTLKKNYFPFKIIMGTFDQVIRPKQAYSFQKRLRIKNAVIEIPNGHNFFKKSSINKFIHLLPFIEQ